MSLYPSDLFPIPTGADPSVDLLFLGTTAYADNGVVAHFSDAPLADDPEGFDSVTNPRNWSVVAVDPSVPRLDPPGAPFVPPGEFVPTFTPEVGLVEIDEDDPKQVILSFNTRLEQQVRLQLTVSNTVRTVDCKAVAAPTVHESRTLRIGVPPAPRFEQQDKLRDFDFTFFPTDPNQPAGSWRFDSNSDIGIQSDEASLKKRILRRLQTSRRGFVNFSDTYGEEFDVKALARSGKLQQLANQAREQAEREPDVLSAGAEARLRLSATGEGVVEIAVRVLRVGRTESRFVLNVPLGT